MSIQPPDSQAPRPVPRPKAPARASSPPPSSPPPAAGPAAQLALSNEARALEALRKAAAAAPDVREAKVAALKRQIEEGRYQLSPEALARVLLRGGSARPLDDEPA